MSNQKQNFIPKESNENIQVYDNDDAYIFGDLQENNNNENIQENNNLNNIFDKNIPNNNNFYSINQISNNNELLNKFNINNINYNENKNDNNNIYNNANININYPNNMNKNLNNINVKPQDITFNQKFSINDMDSEGGGKNEKISNKIQNQSQEQKNEININNNNINNIKSLNNNEEIDNVYNDELNDSNMPLVTLNFLSICQCCKDPFNSTDCIPYLFKCGHFFCKKCILEQFIDEEGIKCPNDGLVAKSISELKILNNFITDKTVTQRTSNSNSIYCSIHKGQKMTHYIEENKELICIYCAFEKFKQNPNWEIKEINDKIKEIEIEIDNIIEENQKNVGIIQNTLSEIKKNKEIEEKKVIEVFDRLYEIIKDKKEDNLNKINTLFKENARKLSQKLELFSNKIEKSEEIKEKINLYNENKEQNGLSKILDDYNKLLIKINDNHYYKLVLQKYKFVYDDEPIIVRLINKFGDFKIIPNNCAFLGTKKNNINNNLNISNNNNFKGNLNYNHSTSKLNINQSQSGMNINIFTNINQDNTSSAVNEPIHNIIKQKLKNNKSYSNISPFQKNKKKINNISNSQYNSFYKQKMIDSNISENKSNINSINMYKNYRNNSKLKTTSKKKKLNNTLDFDINISKNKINNNSTLGLRVNTPSDLVKKNILNNGVNFGNKNKTLNNFSNNKQEKRTNKNIIKPSGLKNNLNLKKNNK